MVVSSVWLVRERLQIPLYTPRAPLCQPPLGRGGVCLALGPPPQTPRARPWGRGNVDVIPSPVTSKVVAPVSDSNHFQSCRRTVTEQLAPNPRHDGGSGSVPSGARGTGRRGSLAAWKGAGLSPAEQTEQSSHEAQSSGRKHGITGPCVTMQMRRVGERQSQ